jgi:GT2 family glycosyltransferase
VDYASANGLLVSRRAWDVVGGFDERYYPAYFEDVDLCLALAAHGFRTRYEPQARVVHRGSQSSSRVYREFLLTRNQRKLVEKWGSALDRFVPRPPRDFGLVFDDAVQQAIERGAGAATAPHPEPRGIALDGSCPRDAADPSRAAEILRAEYQAYLEQRVADRDQRVTTLETYLSKLWGVRLRRWVGGRLERRSG